MDANGQRFWLFGEAGHWRQLDHARWDRRCGAVCLASERVLPRPVLLAQAHAAANSALERVPRALDAHGCVAWWDPAMQAVVARSHLPGDATCLTLAEAPTDLAVGRDGVLYVAVAGRIVMHDLRGRWQDTTVAADAFVAWRIAIDPEGGAWVLERSTGRLARLTGQPMLEPLPQFSPATFRPLPENCRTPLLKVQATPQWPTAERPVALAMHAERGLALLSWAGAGVACVRFWNREGQALGPRLELSGARYAYALDFLADDRLAVRVPSLRDAPAFELPAADPSVAIARTDAAPRGVTLHAIGDIHPLAPSQMEAPFAHRLDGPPRYPLELEPGQPVVAPLHALSLPSLARHGEARSFDRHEDGAAEVPQTRPIDSEDHDTVWHRLYAEARLPPRTGFIVWCAATADRVPPLVDDRQAWSPHFFGEVPTDEPYSAHAAWEHVASELPHHAGVACWPREPGVAGLWSVLVQDPRHSVRRLVGRYLWIRLEMFGDGRSSPEIAAVRAWSSRFSYRDRYLPRLYHEDRHGELAQLPGPALAALPASFAQPLDGAELPDELVDALRIEGIEPGAAPRLEVLDRGGHWRLDDTLARRTWQLRRESETGPDASGGAIVVYKPQATPADFLERLLCNFEGLLTPLEDRIAHAHLLTDPASIPEPGLDWLAAWVGVAFDPALPESRRRQWLSSAAELARLHGTRHGLELALEIASGGLVSGGEIVVIEDFRMRRLLATVLGADLESTPDPLLPGLIVSGNSKVGDTLILGDEERAELLALYRREVASELENAAVLSFHSQLAFRATVLVHQEVERADLALLRRVVELESPAHADVRVVAATWPFLVGVSSLVGVDSYLGPRQPPRPARVDVSLAGTDFVIAPASLDPRLAGAAPRVQFAPPVADAGDDMEVRQGRSFVLDGSGSSADPARTIREYRWRRLPPS